MKIISWNVNGIRACVNKGLINTMKDIDADVYMFQEVRAEKSKLPIVPNYKEFHTFSEKKGYSGVSTYTRLEPINVIEGIGKEEFDKEGRVLTLEFQDFYLVNVYFPNSGDELKRLNYKIDFNNHFLDFCKELEKTKPVIVGSDFNVAHKEIDLARPKQNEKSAGFTIEERNWFSKFVNSGFIDSFREFEPGPKQYTWWTYRGGARDRNVGWRIDYFVVSEGFMGKVKKSEILNKIMGSDHCPIMIEIGIKNFL